MLSTIVNGAEIKIEVQNRVGKDIVCPCGWRLSQGRRLPL